MIFGTNIEFRKFIKRLGNYIARNQAYVQYVAVLEFQKRGAVHYHQVIFNLPYIKTSTIGDIWRNGFIQVKSIESMKLVETYSSEQLSDHYGLVKYTQYQINKGVIQDDEKCTSIC